MPTLSYTANWEIGYNNSIVWRWMRREKRTFREWKGTSFVSVECSLVWCPRTCWLLICMVTIFLICWLPLTIFNFAINSIRMTFKEDDNMFFSLFALCHLLGRKTRETINFSHVFPKEWQVPGQILFSMDFWMKISKRS